MQRQRKTSYYSLGFPVALSFCIMVLAVSWGHAAVFDLGGVNVSAGGWVQLPVQNVEEETVAFPYVLTPTSSILRAPTAYQASSYTGQALADGDSITFDADYTLSNASITGSNGGTISFSGTEGTTLILKKNLANVKGTTLKIVSGTLKFSGASFGDDHIYPETQNVNGGNDINTYIASGATLWMDTNRGMSKNYGKMTIETGGIFRMTQQVIMPACGNVMELQGTARVEIGSKGIMPWYAVPGQTTDAIIRVTGENGNAVITGVEGDGMGYMRIANGGVNAKQNTIFDVQDASSKLTVDVKIDRENSAGFDKIGAGTLVLTNAGNAYSGTTYIKEGTLELAAGAKLYMGSLVAPARLGNADSWKNFVPPSNDKSMVIVGNGAGTSAVLRVDNMQTNFGNMDTASGVQGSMNLVLHGGKIVITGATQEVQRDFSVTSAGGTLMVENAGTTVTFKDNTASGFFWNISGALTIDGPGNIIMKDNLGADGGDPAGVGAINKRGSGTFEIAPSGGSNGGAFSLNVYEGTFKISGKLYGNNNTAQTKVTLGTTKLADDSIVQGTLELADFAGTNNLGNLGTGADKFVIDGGRLLVTGNSQTARNFTVTDQGGTIEMDKAGQTLTVNQNVNVKGKVSVGGTGNVTAMNGQTGRFTGNGALHKIGTGTLTTSLANGYAGSINVEEGELVLNGGRSEGANDNKLGAITLGNDTILTVNAQRAVAQQQNAFTMMDGSKINLNQTYFMAAKNDVWSMQGSTDIVMNASGGVYGINTTYRSMAGTDADGNAVDGYAQMTGGVLCVSQAGTFITLEAAGVNDTLIVDSKIIFEKAGQSINKTGEGLVILGNADNQLRGALNVKAGTLEIAEGARIYTQETYAKEAASIINVGTGTLGSATLKIVDANSLGYLASQADRLKLNGGSLVVTGDSQNLTAVTIADVGAGIFMEKAGQTLTLTQGVNTKGIVTIGGAGNVVALGAAGTGLFTGTGELHKTGTGTLTTSFNNGYDGSVYVDGGELIIEGPRNGEDRKLDEIVIGSGATMTVNGIRSVARQDNDFIMKHNSTLNLNNTYFMGASGTDAKHNVWTMEGVANVNLSNAGSLYSIGTTYRSTAGTDAEGNVVNGMAKIVGGTFVVSSDQNLATFDVVGVNDALILDSKVFTEAAGQNIVKIGKGAMAQNWRDGSDFRDDKVTVKEGTYMATGKMNVGNVVVESGATFSAGYNAAADGKLLNSVGTVDITGNLRVAGRLHVDIQDGKQDIINVAGTVTLDEDFVFEFDELADLSGEVYMPFEMEQYSEATVDLIAELFETGEIEEHYTSDDDAWRAYLADGQFFFADQNAVPEPSTWLMLLLGAGFGGYYIRRKNGKK